jgi:hypothetical protein
MAELRAEVSRLREALTLSEGQDLPRLSLDYSETAALVEARIRLEADVREHQYRIKRALELLEGDTFGNIQAAIIVLSGQ